MFLLVDCKTPCSMLNGDCDRARVCHNVVTLVAPSSCRNAPMDGADKQNLDDGVKRLYICFRGVSMYCRYHHSDLFITVVLEYLYLVG